MKDLIKGTLFGAILAFAWGFVSWMVLPWHMWSVEDFKNPQEVSRVLSKNAAKPAIYLLPPMLHERNKGHAINEEHESEALLQPFMFASIVPQAKVGMSPMTLVASFLGNVCIAFLLALGVKVLSLRTFGAKWLTITFFAFVSGVMFFAPYFVWWHFPSLYVGINILDTTIMWAIAGIGIAFSIKSGPNSVHIAGFNQ